MARLAESDPAALERLRAVVGTQRALIRLDEEAAEIGFDGERFHVDEAPTGRGVDGSGQTDRATVLDLLAGRLEVHTAVLAGRLEVHGDEQAVARMMLAIEILLDVSSREPSLQALAREYWEASPRPGVVARRGQPPPAWYPRERGPLEDELLARLDLLPGQGTS